MLIHNSVLIIQLIIIHGGVNYAPTGSGYHNPSGTNTQLNQKLKRSVIILSDKLKLT